MHMLALFLNIRQIIWERGKCVNISTFLLTQLTTCLATKLNIYLYPLLHTALVLETQHHILYRHVCFYQKYVHIWASHPYVGFSQAVAKKLKAPVFVKSLNIITLSFPTNWTKEPNTVPAWQSLCGQSELSEDMVYQGLCKRTRAACTEPSLQAHWITLIVPRSSCPVLSH